MMVFETSNRRGAYWSIYGILISDSCSFSSRLKCSKLVLVLKLLPFTITDYKDLSRRPKIRYWLPHIEEAVNLSRTSCNTHRGLRRCSIVRCTPQLQYCFSPKGHHSRVHVQTHLQLIDFEPESGAESKYMETYTVNHVNFGHQQTLRDFLRFCLTVL